MIEFRNIIATANIKPTITTYIAQHIHSNTRSNRLMVASLECLVSMLIMCFFIKPLLIENSIFYCFSIPYLKLIFYRQYELFSNAAHRPIIPKPRRIIHLFYLLLICFITSFTSDFHFITSHFFVQYRNQRAIISSTTKSIFNDN